MESIIGLMEIVTKVLVLSFIVGHYEDGKQCGEGELCYQNGNKYVGEWKDNKRHGNGEYICSDGRIYKGGYQNDKREGEGMEIEGDKEIKGEWQKGVMVYKYKDGVKIKVEPKEK